MHIHARAPEGRSGKTRWYRDCHEHAAQQGKGEERQRRRRVAGGSVVGTRAMARKLSVSEEKAADAQLRGMEMELARVLSVFERVRTDGGGRVRRSVRGTAIGMRRFGIAGRVAGLRRQVGEVRAGGLRGYERFERCARQVRSLQKEVAAEQGRVQKERVAQEAQRMCQLLKLEAESNGGGVKRVRRPLGEIVQN